MPQYRRAHTASTIAVIRVLLNSSRIAVDLVGSRSCRRDQFLPRVIVNDAVTLPQSLVPSLLHQSFASVSSPSTILIKRPSSSMCCRRLRIRRSSTRAVGHSVVANTKSARQHRSLNIDSRVAERVVLHQLQSAARHHASAEVVEIDVSTCSTVESPNSSFYFNYRARRTITRPRKLSRSTGIIEVNVVACDVGTADEPSLVWNVRS